MRSMGFLKSIGKNIHSRIGQEPTWPAGVRRDCWCQLTQKSGAPLEQNYSCCPLTLTGKEEKVGTLLNVQNLLTGNGVGLPGRYGSRVHVLTERSSTAWAQDSLTYLKINADPG